MMMKMSDAAVEENSNLIKVTDLVSEAYLLPWYSQKRDIVIKGSKGSGKSKFASLWIIYNMMLPENKLANTLVVRQVFDTLSGSCYIDLLWAIDRLKVTHLWTYTKSPLMLTYNPTGQVILFRGFDDPIKIASINVRYGYLCWIWFEEATQIENYDGVQQVEASIRAIPPETGLHKRFMFTFNPWSDQHWLKKVFFDKPYKKTLAMTTTYRDNPYFTKEDREYYDELRKTGSKLARVICEGEWGIIEGQIYDNWEVVESIDVEGLLENPDVREAYGLDFGYSISATAFVAMLVNPKTKEIWLYDEIYGQKMLNWDIAREITNKGYNNKRIIADSAEPKSIAELRSGVTKGTPETGYVTYALPSIQSARKGSDSVNNGIARVQMYHIYILDRLENSIANFANYCWARDREGKYTGKPEKENDHAPDAVRYGMEPFLMSARGKVAEAKGIDGYKPAYVPSKGIGARRVYSTHE